MRRLIPYFPALVMDFCLGTIMTNTAFFSTSLSLTASFIGTLGAISTLLFSIFAIPFGRLSDRVGRPILLGAGCLLVFILAIGYYITPALVGGASGTLISNQIAFHMKSTLDWSFASAMGLMLLTGVLAIYWLYNKLVGIDNIKLG